MDFGYLFLMLLGTTITRMFTLHRDSEEERKNLGYQFLMFCLYFLLYIPVYGIITWLMH